jgi:hypothetical protein
MNRFLYVALGIALAAAGCTSTDQPPIPTTGPTLLTQDFQNGDTYPLLTQNGAISFPFAVQVSGEVAATLVTLAPDSTVVVGLGIGLWDGVACQAIPGVWNDRATLGSRVVGQVTGAASLCVRIYDARGDLPQPTEYLIRVEHY